MLGHNSVKNVEGTSLGQPIGELVDDVMDEQLIDGLDSGDRILGLEDVHGARALFVTTT